MDINNITINDDAIFIADSHFNLNKIKLELFLLNILEHKIITSQLFLLGDIFDFLSNEIIFFKNKNKNIINLLNKISKDTVLIYLEGNHDFNLKNIFPRALVIPRKYQPVKCIYQDKAVFLAHGDLFISWSYEFFTLIFRNKYFQYFINIIDINNWLSKKFNRFLMTKKICNKCDNFVSFANKRIRLYKNSKNSIIIEGHFHFGNIYDNYVNIPSLTCDKKYFSLKYGIVSI